MHTTTTATAGYWSILRSLFPRAFRCSVASTRSNQRYPRLNLNRNLHVSLIRIAVAVIMTLFPVALRAREKELLKLVDAIPLPDLREGDFDHFALDLEGHRLFLTAEQNGKVFVFDTNTNKLIHTISDLKAPHSAVYRADSRKLFVVDGDDSAVKVYNGDTYELTGQVKVEIDADSVAYDPATHYLYVVNGGREAHTQFSYISVIDTNEAKKLKDIKIDSNWVEAIILEKTGPRLFCNITGENAVAVFDRTSDALVVTW